MKSTIAEKLGDRYKLLSGADTARIIKETMDATQFPLTRNQYYALTQKLGNSGIRGNLDMPFIAYSWEERKSKVSFVWRLTVPFFAIYWFIFVFFIRPVKWLLTGTSQFSQKSWITRFNLSWFNHMTARSWGE